MLLDDGFCFIGNVAAAFGGAFDQAFFDMRGESMNQDGLFGRTLFSGSHWLYL